MVKTWQLIAVSAVAGLALSVAAVAAAGPWDSGQRKAERDRAASWGLTGGADHGGGSGGGSVPQAAPSAPGVLSGVGPDTLRKTGSGVAAADPGRLADVLRPLLADPALGTVRTASVVDTATGQVLFESGPREPMTPASTTKIATASAALAALGPDYRIRTTVTPGAGPGEIVLVGGGDPSSPRRRRAPPDRAAASSPSPPTPPRPSRPPAPTPSASATTTPSSPGQPATPSATTPTSR